MTKNQLTPEIRVEILAEKEKGSSIRTARDNVNKKLGVALNYHNVRDVYNDLLSDIFILQENINKAKEGYEDKINEINKQLKRETRYEIIGDDYVITIKDTELEAEQVFRFHRDEVRDMFRDFSKHGGNKTQEEMVAKYCNGYPEVWHLIKARFKLYKLSHIVDPDTLENATEEHLDKANESAIHYHIDVKKEKLKVKYDDIIKKEYNKLLDRVISGEVFLEKIKEILEVYKPEDFQYKPLPEVDSNYVIAFGADHHCDGSDEGDKSFIEFTEDLCNVKEERVVIVINGDDLETIVEAGMHPGQTNKMHKTGKNLITHYISLWEYAVGKLKEAKKEVEIFFEVDSNHMRIEESNKKDKEKIGGWLMFQFIQLKLQLIGADVKLLEDKTNSLMYDNFHLILDHGHNGFNNKKGKDIVYEKGGSKDKINVIVSAHDHNVNITNPAKNILWIKLPALKPDGGDFADEHFLSANSGYVALRKDKRGLPRTEIILLN